LHDERRQEQGKRDHHHVRRRLLQTKGAAHAGQHDHDACEAGHHDQQPRCHAENSQQDDGLDDSPAEASAFRLAKVDRQALRLRRARQGDHCGGAHDKREADPDRVAPPRKRHHA